MGMRAWMRGAAAALVAATVWLQATAALAQTPAGDAPVATAASTTPVPAAAPADPPVVAQVSQPTATASAQAAKPSPINGADTAWMLISTVLVLLMTIPGIILFYGGMLRTKNALSIVPHTLAATALITVMWALCGYSIAFTNGNPYFGDWSRVFANGLIGKNVGVHVAAPTIPESVFFLFQLSFAIITFALILGATAERMRLGVTVAFAALWSVLVYAPVAHWNWHPNGWLAKMGHMDFAGGTVVHI